MFSSSHSRDIVQLPSGTKLEYILSHPPLHGTETESKLAVCLHPWSWLGGRMDDPVLRSLTRALHARGYHVLRYNSRGVGKSTGWSSFTGSREAQDLRELVPWALGQIKPTPATLVIIGYSHGALIASTLPAQPDPGVKTTHVLLSYPLGPRHWLTAFQGKTYTAALHALLHSARSQVLMIYGDEDEFTPDASYEAWVRDLQAEADAKVEAEASETESGGGDHKRLEVMKVNGGTHFWRGEDGERMVEWVLSRLP